MKDPPTTRAIGEAADTRALDHLEAAGLVLVLRNYRLARRPSSRGGAAFSLCGDA